ncbi:Txe/YoeB family addiction module toxin [Candidatus Peregrinibacteria bacterium]|nr:Txe/YoeB family addiction module toxin [Candidatus Peregrinibacteria bacterium]
MSIVFTDAAYKDYLHWKRHDRKKYERINTLCKAILQKPREGIGKPEPLLYDLQGYWSRRIDRTHRLVYKVKRGEILVISCRFHY